MDDEKECDGVDEPTTVDPSGTASLIDANHVTGSMLNELPNARRVPKGAHNLNRSIGNLERDPTRSRHRAGIAGKGEGVMKFCPSSSPFDEPTPENQWLLSIPSRVGKLRRAFETGRVPKLDERDRAALRRTITGIEIGWLPIRIDSVNFTTDRVRTFRQGAGLMIETILALAVAADNEIIGAALSVKFTPPRNPGDLTSALVNSVIENSFEAHAKERPNTDAKYARSFNAFCKQLGLPEEQRRQRLV